MYFVVFKHIWFQDLDDTFKFVIDVDLVLLSNKPLSEMMLAQLQYTIFHSIGLLMASIDG